ncbi:MAG: acetyl-CoA hydrolase/transferase family protein [Candidatus Binatia bacterium]
MKLVTPTEAIRAIPDGSIAIFPHGCVEPTTLYTAFQQEVDRFHHLTIYSGLAFGEYAFLRRGLGTNFRYVTWQAAPRIRQLFKEKKAGFSPMRFSEITRLVNKNGPVKPNVVVTQVSPPEADGTVSLGISVSLYQDFIDSASLVIAEVNPNMPVTAGNSRVPMEKIHLAVESSTPLGEYHTPHQSERDKQIADYVLNLIPDHAWVQLGVGSVPDLILYRLAEKPRINLYSGMLSQGLIHFVEHTRHTPKIITGELAGDKDLYAFCGRTPLVEMATSSVTHNILLLAKLPRFVSINSAVEIDLHGQSNGETIGDTQISGVGGSLDYVEAAALSDSGLSVIALPSTTEDGKHSKIVSRLGGGIVTTPRFCTDYIVTEYGVARLRGKDLRARAEALIAIAHPDFRDELAEHL